MQPLVDFDACPATHGSLVLGGNERKTAVDEVGGAGHVGGAIGGKPRDQLADFPRSPGASERHVDLVGLLILLPGHSSGDLSGGDSVDANSVRTELQRHNLREAAEPVLGGRVGSRARQRDVLVHGRDVDDRPAASLLDHPAGRRLPAEERRGEVEVEHRAPVRERHLEEWGGRSMSRVVDQRVDPAEGIRELLDRARADLDLAQVGVPRLATAPEPLDLGHRALGAALITVPGDTEVKAAGGECNRGGATDAAVTSGDDRSGHGNPLSATRPMKPPARAPGGLTQFGRILAGYGKWMAEDPKAPPARSSIGLNVVRYGIGAGMVLAGIVIIAINPGGFGVDGFAMAVGGGLSVLLINFLFRLGVSGDKEREQEEAARRYFDEHGVWPDEEPKARGRQWTLAPGVVTAEQEKQEQERPTG